jgi:Fe-S oxidoreductase
MLAGQYEDRFGDFRARAVATWRYAFKQEKMDYYQPSGTAHRLIFLGFLVLTIRTIVLVGRGFDSSFNLWILAPDSPLGKAYEFAKDSVAFCVLAGVSVFVYFRKIKPQKRMTLHWEGMLILGIIAVMMLADMAYDGASLVLSSKYATFCGADAQVSAIDACARAARIIAPLGHGHDIEWSPFPSPGGSAFSVLFKGLPVGALTIIATAGFWTHVSLVLLFLNLLPHSKHFHVITAIPNVFFTALTPKGRLEPMAATAEALMEEKLGPVFELENPTAGQVGVARIDHFSWKAILDFYTCTECGRCSDNCPAHRTGKLLSPKHLTLALRDHLYENETNIVERGMKTRRSDDPKPEVKEGEPEIDALKLIDTIDLVPNIVHPDVLWACTTCRACEEQCPVMISYVDKIVDMRRNLVMIKGEFPHTLQKPFQAMETNGNPWNLSRMDRAAWSDGLGVVMMADNPKAEVLYWVGCAASYDDRAKKIARATTKLMQAAGVDFAILGQEESCTGDPARRAGNELLFAQLAETNAEVLNGYKEQGGIRTIVTACPHCFNSLKNEYPDFGAKFEVVHHAEFLLGLLAMKKIIPSTPVEGKIVYHDSCYLGRYNGVYEAPRDILRAIPGVELLEVDYWSKSRGLCCGAGGAQMWMEEQNTDRVNVKRTLQLIDTGAKTIASGCPFCMTMITDGLKSQSLEEEIKPMDVAELLEKSCLTPKVQDAPVPPVAPPPQPELESTAAAE